MRTLALLVVCLCMGCNVQPVPRMPLAQSPQVEARPNVENSRTATNIQSLLRDQPKADVRALADTAAALAKYIGEGNVKDKASAFRLISRTFDIHPVIAKMEVAGLDAAVNAALVPWSKPGEQTGWAKGMADALTEIANGAAAAAK